MWSFPKYLIILVCCLFGCMADPRCKIYNYTYADCTMRSFSHTPKDLPVSTTHMELSYNAITSLPSRALSRYVQLKSLTLDANDITAVSAGSFTGLHRLERLILSNNEISSIAQQAFTELSKLQYLDLSSNNLTTISENTFFTLQNLKVLILCDNRLQLSPLSFSGLLSLETLDLDANPFSGINDNIFQQRDFRRLRKLSLEGCQVTDTVIPDMNLNETEMQIVVLRSNNISSPDPGAFSGMRNVSNVDLGMNMLDVDSLEMSLYDFRDSRIRILSLNRQQMGFSFLRATTLKGLQETYLEELDLSNNALAELPVGGFKWLQHLKKLDLSQNNIPQIQQGVFQGLQNLNSLDLSYNNLEYLQTSAFDGLVNITELKLNFNMLNDLSGLMQIVYHLSGLESCYLQQNQFQGEITQDTFDKMSSLILLDISYNRISSLHPNCFKSLSKLQYLDLSNNVLQSLPNGVFSDLIAMESLHLSGSKAVSLHQHPFLHVCQLKKLSVTIENTSDILALADIPDMRELSISIPQTCINISDLQMANLSMLQKLKISYSCISGELLPYTFKSLEILSLYPITFTKFNVTFFLTLFPNVKQIDLSADDPLDMGVLPKQLPKLEYLTFTNVKNDIVDVKYFKSWTKLKLFNALPDSFDCSGCKMKPFLDWMKTDMVVRLPNLITGKPSCGKPDDMTSVSIYSLSFGLKCNLAFIISVPVAVVFVIVCVVIIIWFRYHLAYWIFLGKLKFGGYQLQVNDDDGPRGRRYDAFVCYNEHDSDWVWQELVPHLEDIDPPNFRLCIHERDFKLGNDIFENILDSIENSHKTMLILSPHFAQSEWCYFEMRIAQNYLFEQKRDVILMVLLETIPDNVLPRVLRQLLLTKKYISWAENEAGQRLFWEKLKVALTSENRVNRVANV